MKFEQVRSHIEKISGGRVSLRKYEEYHSCTCLSEPIREFRIESKEDIPCIRQEVDRLFEKSIRCWGQVRWPILLTLSEAVTNVVKHTPGGRLLVFRRPEGPCFHVIDRGTGIDLDLASAILFDRGFSTSSSLGMGFPIMIEYGDRITLYTSNQGTVLILQFDLEKECI